MNKRLRAEYSYYSRIASAFTGKDIFVKDVESNYTDQVGYTDIRNSIHVNTNHPIMKTLSDEKKQAFRMGVFAHELLHKLLSDFEIYNSGICKYRRSEQPIIQQIANVMEDPAIEYFGSEEIGGDLIESLHFSIAHIWKESIQLEDVDNEFGQYIMACIQFGDMGALKGHFTFERAKKTFADTIGYIESCIKEPDPAERFRYAEKVFELTRPMWQAAADLNEILEQIKDVMRACGKGGSIPAGEAIIRPTKPEKSSNPVNQKKEERRKLIVIRITDEEQEEEKGEELKPEDLEDADIIVIRENSNQKESEQEEPGLKDEKEGFSGKGSSDSDKDAEKEDFERHSKEDSDGDEKTDVTFAGGDNETKEITDSDKDLNECGSNKSEEDNPSHSPQKNKNGLCEEDVSEEENYHNEEISGGTDTDKNTHGESQKSSQSRNSSFQGEEADNENGSEENGDDFDADLIDLQQSVSSSDEAKGYTPDLKEADDVSSSNGQSYADAGVEVNEEEFELSEDVIESIQKTLEAEERELENSADEKAKKEGEPINPVISSPLFIGKVSCENKVIQLKETSGLEQTYAFYLSSLNGLVNQVKNQLKRIFLEDNEEILFKTSGKINMKRLNSGRVTAKIFQKKKDPADKNDMAVAIIIDESGSMHGGKITAARKAAILFAEVFDSLDIPIYIMGFKEGRNGAAVHDHFIRWANSPKERLKLLSIEAGGENFDGYSIRYITEILKRKKVKHKLLIVMSDGAPASSHYVYGSVNGKQTHMGIVDTYNAVREAKKVASVLGVAIGNADTEKIRTIYERDFLHISNIDELASNVAKVIKGIVAKWDV